MSRYGRIVRRALIDQLSKRFIVWTRDRYIDLMQALHNHKQHLERTHAATKSVIAKQEVKIGLVGSGAALMNAVNGATNKRYKSMARLRSATFKHLNQVSVDEQPFKRVWDLAQYARRRHIATDAMIWDPDAVQIGESLRVGSLLFRCNLAVIADFLSLETKGDITVDFSQAKVECLALAEAAKQSHLYLQQAEGHVFYAGYCAMGRSLCSAEQIAKLVEDGKDNVEKARKLCQDHPDSTRIVVAEVDEVEKMLREATFYATMKDEERKEVLAAMKKERIGTGHWYTCENGHPFAIGECGRPIQEVECPECGSPVGGQSHRAA